MAQAEEHKNLYRDLDRILRGIDEAKGLESMLSEILRELTATVFRAAGIESGRLYREDDGAFVIVQSYGALGKNLIGKRVSRDYAILGELDERSVLHIPPEDSRRDEELENSLGVGHFAAFYVGPEHRYLAAFGFDAGVNSDELLLMLNTVRYAIQRRLRELTFAGQLREAHEIQMSSLPKKSPEFSGYEIAGLSRPAEEVGGDILDFLPIDPHLLGVALGDASGHGLPAALQARDVITGLRMGVERDYKITAVMRRLNSVIHRGGLSSRFVSLFYGELETSGNFVYVSAGHDPGILLRADGKEERLESTGIVMGPIPDISYRRNLARLEPGDTLLLYTDGLCERLGRGEELGLPGLIELTRKLLATGEPIETLPKLILEAVFDFGDRTPWLDDATVLLIRRNSKDDVGR